MDVLQDRRRAPAPQELDSPNVNPRACWTLRARNAKGMPTNTRRAVGSRQRNLQEASRLTMVATIRSFDTAAP